MIRTGETFGLATPPAPVQSGGTGSGAGQGPDPATTFYNTF
jgi:hypothetical protein